MERAEISKKDKQIYITRNDDQSKRCAKAGGFKRYISHFEVGSDTDLDLRSLAADSKLQQYIQKNIHSGMRLKLIKCPEGTKPYVVYRIVLEDNMRALFRECGYSTEFRPLNASDYGVLQNRKRIILIGVRGEHEDFYPEIPVVQNRYLVNEVFGDLPAIAAGGGTTEPVPTAHYDGEYLYESGIKEYDTEPVTFHQARPHTEQDLEIYRIVVDTWNRTGTRVSYVDLPENLRTHQNTASFLDRFKVVAGNLPYAQTIVAHIARDGHYFIHPDIEQNRSITPREAARIQTFPDNYCFESKKGTPSRTLAFKQIGNAVPVCLAYHIALSLLARFADQN